MSLFRTSIAVVMCALVATSRVAYAQSAVDGFDPGANSGVTAAAVQPDGKIVVVGYFTALGGGTGTTPRNRVGRFLSDGTLDTGFDPDVNDEVDAVALQPDGKILIGGLFTTVSGVARSRIARLNLDGSLDPTFDPGANNFVGAFALQTDGKIVVGGFFTTLGGGGTGTTSRQHIARLNADGSVDTGFDPGANGVVGALAVQPNGRILVGGNFTTFGGGGTGTTTRNRLARVNSDGSLDTAFNPGANQFIAAVAVQPDGKIVVVGNFTTIGGGGTGTSARLKIARLNGDGSLDTAFTSGLSGASNYGLAAALQPDGRIVVAGSFTTVSAGGVPAARSNIGRFNQDGSVDMTFDPGVDNVVFALVIQADGRILVGGDFSRLGGGGTGTPTRNSLGRLYPDGSLDAIFNPGADNVVFPLALQPDGKILAGGFFTTLAGSAQNNLGRLNPDGTIDLSFGNPGANGFVTAFLVQPDGKILVGGAFTGLGGGGATPRSRIGRLNANGSLDAFNPGANDVVNGLALQPDGKIIVVGNFTTLAGVTRSKIGRLNADGSIDASFDPGANGAIVTVALQPDGKILVAGGFTTLGGGGTGVTLRRTIGRLNANGSVDTTFDPGASGGAVLAMMPQADGKILVGGTFTALGGATGTTPRSKIGRLNADGTVDTFNPGANDYVSTFGLQSDGKIVVGGGFIMLGNGATATRIGIGRLNPDGSLDAFDPGVNAVVNAVLVQSDGKIVVGGYFTTLGTQPRSYIGRLTNTGAASQGVSVTGAGTVVTWLRAGTGPEVSRVTFESSVDGAVYTSLGSGTRVTGGWQLTGVSLPPNQNLFIRARGYEPHPGFDTGSGSIVQTIRNAYVSCAAVSPASLAAAVAGVAYSTTFTAPTAIGVVTFGELGALPAGLTFSAGVLSGTPTQTGSFPIAVTATDASSGCATSQNVTLTVTCPTITLSATTFPAGAPNTAYASTTVTQTGGVGATTFVVSAGALPAGLTLSSAGTVSGTPTATGTFTFTVTAIDANGCTGSRAYSIAIAGLPTVALSASAVNFGAVNSGGVLTVQTPAQNVRLTQSGPGAIAWTASADRPWISVSPPSGNGPGTIAVSVNNNGSVLPAAGLLTGTITLTTTGAANSLAVPVTLTIIAGSSAPPSGVVDTPNDGQGGLTGSIAVTGWAIDDIGVSAIRVCRGAAAGEPAPIQPLCGSQPKIYIGDAVLVAGARPDVAGANPTRPFYDRAGWGYLLLTNFLPNQGNGTVTLTAFAEDYDGFTTPLGSKTIACTNATATLPFGAIDTPGQGGTASGAGYVNFGWALAAQPTGRSIPTDGSTIQVYIDSAAIGVLDWYNNPRTDIQTLFPGYANTNGAIGFKMLNTTTMTNGVHTIAWVVTDNLGAAAGIGSRFFTISNSSVIAGASTDAQDGLLDGRTAIIDASRPRLGAAASLASIARNDFGVAVTHGYDADALPEIAMPDSDGVRHVRTAQLERLVLDLDPAGAGGTFTGYLVDGADLRALPAGSHLDAASGGFAWAPGLAFGGTHALAFVRDLNGHQDEIRVNVGVDAERAAKGDPRLVIDTPSAGATVAQPFTIAGWAFDPSGPANRSGIDTLHVWAYPVDAGNLNRDAPVIFVGVAAYGGLRPDVGDLFGPRFARSGYSIDVAGLRSGTYDLVVYAHSMATGDFAIARTVRVTVR